ncbi:MAG: hypothetical protein RIC87_07910 [Kiloniellales bacterium]
MSEARNAPKWRIYSAQRAVPRTSGVGQHNYLVLRGPDGKVYAEIHGTTSDNLLSGKLVVREFRITFDNDGAPVNSNPLNLGDEDRKNWVEVPPLKGTNALKTWNKFKKTAEKYNSKYDYRFLPSGKTSRLGDTHGQFYETMPTYNSNSAWRTILEDNGYDWERYHPKEGTFSTSPGDGHRLPQLEDARPAAAGRPSKQRKPIESESISTERNFSPGDRLR